MPSGNLHRYVNSSNRLIFEYGKTVEPRIGQNGHHTLLFIHGLGDGLLANPHLEDVNSRLPPHWHLAEILLTSAHKGWGTSSITEDATEIAQCVAYLQGLQPGKNVVLMGHSTGCQDVLEYLTGEHHAGRPAVQGAILQAPVSDREGFSINTPPAVLRYSANIAQRMVDRGDGDDLMNRALMKIWTEVPCTARRWLSLVSPNHDGADDMFSSDLTDQQLKKTFGNLSSSMPLCILYAGNDEHVPSSVDKEALVQRFIKMAKQGGAAVDEEHSGIIPWANHQMNATPEVLKDLTERVLGFIHVVDGAES